MVSLIVTGNVKNLLRKTPELPKLRYVMNRISFNTENNIYTYFFNGEY